MDHFSQKSFKKAEWQPCCCCCCYVPMKFSMNEFFSWMNINFWLSLGCIIWPSRSFYEKTFAKHFTYTTIFECLLFPNIKYVFKDEFFYLKFHHYAIFSFRILKKCTSFSTSVMKAGPRKFSPRCAVKKS